MNLLVLLAKPITIQLRRRGCKEQPLTTTATMATALADTAPAVWRLDRPTSQDILVSVRALFARLTGEAEASIALGNSGKWSEAVRRELTNHILAISTLCYRENQSLVDTLPCQSRFWLALAALAVFTDKSWMMSSSRYRSLLENTMQTPVSGITGEAITFAASSM